MRSSKQFVSPPSTKKTSSTCQSARVKEVRGQLSSTISDLRQSNTDLRTSNTELRSIIIELRQSTQQATQQSTEIINQQKTEIQLLNELTEELKAQLTVEKSRTVLPISPTANVSESDPTNNLATVAALNNDATVSVPVILSQHELIEELRAQLTVERSRTVIPISPTVNINANNPTNNHTTMSVLNNDATVSVPIVPPQQTSTTTNTSVQTMSPVSPTVIASVNTVHDNNTVSTPTVLTRQPSTTATSVQRSNIKASPPESFSGEKVRLVGDWLAAVKRYLSLYGVEETKWVAYAVTMLTSIALSWWNSVEVSSPNKSTLDYSWSEFVELMRERFVPADSEAMAMRKMSQWKQTSSVAAYINQFQSFDQLIPSHRLDEEMRVQMFIQGLKPECRLIVNMWEPKTLQQVYKMALKFDNNQHQNLQKFNQFNSTRLNRNPTLSQQEGTRNNPITIYNTELQNDHQSTVLEEEEIDNLNQMSKQNVQKGFCFYCKSPDHYQNSCPKLKLRRQTANQTSFSLVKNNQSMPHSKN